MDYKTCLMMSLWPLLVISCTADSTDTPSTQNSYTSDAQYICETLVECFGIDVGVTCADDIVSTTNEKDIAACATCYEYASCEEIGDPGTPGVCDQACNDALFGGG